MPTRLLNLRLRRISVVDVGDNPDANIMLIKRKNRKTDEVDNMGDADKVLELSDEQREALVKEAVEKALAKAAEETKKAEDKAKADAEAKAADELKKAKEKVLELEKARGDTKKEKEGLEDELAKVKADVTEAHKLIAAQADREAEESAVAKLKSWENVPDLKTDDPDALASLKAVRKSCPKHADVLEGLIDRCNKAIGESDLFTATGSDEAGGGDALAALNAKAAELKKAKPELDDIQAMALAQDQNPDLLAQYSKEYMAKDGRFDRSAVERGY